MAYRRRVSTLLDYGLILATDPGMSTLGVSPQTIMLIQADASIVRAVLNMGHSMHMLVVGEGVEKAEQPRMLREQSCPEARNA